jgi:hypothetical protein
LWYGSQTDAVRSRIGELATVLHRVGWNSEL